MARHTSTGKRNGDSSHDHLREYLIQKGCPDHVVKGGLRGLVETWEIIVTEVSHGYDLTLDDYLNDMDTRQLIDEVQDLASTPSDRALLRRLERMDAMMKTMLEPSRHCLWGEAAAKDRRWNRPHHWWYYMQPKHPGPDLQDELDARNNMENEI